MNNNYTIDSKVIIDYILSPLLLEGQGEAKENGTLRSILLTHSKAVAEKAVATAEKHAEMKLDKEFLFTAAMLHDIGIVRCNAPGISCFGTEPYIRHGICGGELLKDYANKHGIPQNAIEPYVRVCRRHTGAGISVDDIREQNLDLPIGEYLPETLEEKLICYADKFFSKTRLTEEKPFERVLASLQKFGQPTVERFLEMHRLFE